MKKTLVHILSGTIVTIQLIAIFPIAVAFSEPPFPKAIKKLSDDDFKPHTIPELPAGVTKYFISDEQQNVQPKIARVDLNGDGEDELIVAHPYVYASGGTYHDIYQKRENYYESIGYLGASFNISILEKKNGFAQIESWSSGGGGYLTRGLHRFNGEEYQIIRIDDYRFERFDDERVEYVYIATRYPEYTSATDSLPSAQSTQTDPRPVIHVSSAEEFIQAIGSDRIITIAEGEYILSTVQDRYLEFVHWDKVYDGKTITIRNVNNLKIVGLNEDAVKLFVRPRYAYILNFEHCNNIELVNLVMGHTPEQGHCVGGVLGASNCSNVTIRNCELFGSGTEGLTFMNVIKFRFDNSVIRGCTNSIMNIDNSHNLEFIDSAFQDNVECYSGIRTHDSESVEFRNCTFTGNKINDSLFDAISSSNISLKNCTVGSNILKNLSNNPDIVRMLSTPAGAAAQSATQPPPDIEITKEMIVSEFPIEDIEYYEFLQPAEKGLVYVRAVSKYWMYERDETSVAKMATILNGIYRIQDKKLYPVWENNGGSGYDEWPIEADFFCGGDCVEVEEINTYYADRLFCIENTWTYFREYDMTLYCMNLENPHEQVLELTAGSTEIKIDEQDNIKIIYECDATGSFGSYNFEVEDKHNCPEGAIRRCFQYNQKTGLYHEITCQTEKDKEKYNSEGEKLYNEGKYQEALQYFLHAYELEGSDERTLKNLATTYLQLHDYPKAIQHSIEALCCLFHFQQINDIYKNLGQAYEQSGYDLEAIYWYKQASVDPIAEERIQQLLSKIYDHIEKKTLSTLWENQPEAIQVSGTEDSYKVVTPYIEAKLNVLKIHDTPETEVLLEILYRKNREVEYEYTDDPGVDCCEWRATFYPEVGVVEYESDSYYPEPKIADVSYDRNNERKEYTAGYWWRFDEQIKQFIPLQ